MQALGECIPPLFARHVTTLFANELCKRHVCLMCADRIDRPMQGETQWCAVKEQCRFTECDELGMHGHSCKEAFTDRGGHVQCQLLRALRRHVLGSCLDHVIMTLLTELERAASGQQIHGLQRGIRQVARQKTGPGAT